MCEYWELNIEKHQPTVEVRYDNLTLHIRKTSVKFFLKELGGKEVRLNFSFLYFFYLNNIFSEFWVLFITLKKMRLVIYNNIERCLWVVLWRDCRLHSNKTWSYLLFEIINLEVFLTFCLDINFYFLLKIILTVQI